MTEIRIQHPVCTLDRKVLLPAGTTVCPEVLHGLISSRPTGPPLPLPLLGHKTVEEDTVLFMGSGPYRRIFGGADRISRILGLMREVRLVLPVLRRILVEGEA